MEGPEIKAVEAVIDNGSFGKRTLRFETGRLAQQADGAVAAYLDDDSMILSTTTAGSSPKENYDFFPLTVDFNEKMYAAGRIPGGYLKREGRPQREGHAHRTHDRPPDSPELPGRLPQRGAHRRHLARRRPGQPLRRHQRHGCFPGHDARWRALRGPACLRAHRP